MQKKFLPILFLAFALCFAAGCVSEETAETGDTVSVYYTLSLDDGSIYQSNVGQTPFSFVLGSGQVVPGFDAAVLGMTVGKTKTVRLAPSEAYGEITEDMIMPMLLSDIKESLGRVPDKGEVLIISSGSTQAYGKVMSIDENRNTVHIAVIKSPLVGEYLTFEITLDSIA